MNFKLMDFTTGYANAVAYREEQLAWEAGGEVGPPPVPGDRDFNGSSHIAFLMENGRVKVQGAPIQNVISEDGTLGSAWGPVQQQLRAKTYGEPVKEGTLLIDRDGSWGTWVKEKGYVEGVGTKPVVRFDTSGICSVLGYAPNGDFYNVGDKSGHPSGAPTGLPIPVGATKASALADLARAADIYSKL
jgi:hypothetical protein